MTKISRTTKDITVAPQKYTRLIITKDSKDYHRLVETADGTLEYRLGVGAWDKITPRQFITLVRSAVQAAKSHQITHLAVQFSTSPFPKLASYGDDWVVRTIAENLSLAAYDFTPYKTNRNSKKDLQEILVCGTFTKTEQAAFAAGLTVADFANKARDIANTPGDDMAPSQLAKKAVEIAKGTKVSVTVLDPKAVQKEGLHALWAVGKGAADLPRFIIMEYWGAEKPSKTSADNTKKPIVLVGKGITYDTGGINVKPSGFMHDMHLDMSGGASVIAAICAAAKLGVKKNIVALIPAAENAISEKSMRAGDIINSHSGKTIQVLHTDAEGRLILADGLSYAAKYNPRVILDVATLTGAALVALGKHASAILTEDDTLREKIQVYAEQSGDYVWPLPLWDEYKVPLTKTPADVANIHPDFSRYGGTIEGAAFLSFFAPKNIPWAHIDMAPRMDSNSHDKLSKGAAGEPVRLLVTFLESY